MAGCGGSVGITRLFWDLITAHITGMGGFLSLADELLQEIVDEAIADVMKS